MNCVPYQWIDREAKAVGACAVGVATVGAVEPEAVDCYSHWIAQGHHAGMDYMTRYADVRSDPELLLPGAKSLIVCAFSYYNEDAFRLPVALYARGRDYHEVLRHRLSVLAERLLAEFGGETRVCVDTAPLRERYWAVKAGLGVIGVNNQLIVPRHGSYVFLGTVLWTGMAEASAAAYGDCGRCGRCVSACPVGALSADGAAVDARKCLSYLTIEHRGDFPPEANLCRHLYGCDECQRVCPHNQGIPITEIPEFHPAEEFASLTAEQVAEMTPEGFSALFRHSAVKRVKLSGLQRNLSLFLRGHK